jgi:hypothetical protein
MYRARKLKCRSFRASTVRREAVLADVRMFAAQLDAVAGLPRQARGSRLRAHSNKAHALYVLYRTT